MANNEVKIVINAVDNASSKVKGLSGSFQGLRDNIPGLNNVLNLMENPLALAAAGIGAVVAITKKSITETVAYNKQIREMTQVMGLSAEETSRLVQVGETWGITSDEIRTSLAFMNKKGIEPSIDNLAKMADEYVNSSDKSKWAEEAVKNLGRGYQTLIPLFALGGDGLRKATAAIDSNLIATDKSIAASREYEVGVDKLTKSWQGFKYTVGNEVIPILDKLFSELNNQTTSSQTLREEWDKGLITQKEYANALRDLRTKGQAVIEVWDGMDKGDRDLVKVTDSFTTSIHIATTSIADQKEAALDDMNALGKANGLAKAAADAKEAMDNLSWELSEPLTKSNQDFITQQDDIKQKMADIQTEIAKDITKGYNPMSDTILGLKDDYQKLSDQYDTNATNHEADTKRIIYDLFTQKLAEQGMDDPALFAQIAKDWGLVSQAELDEMSKASDAVNWLRDHPGDIATAEAILLGQQSSWEITAGKAAGAAQAVWEYHQNLNNVDGKVVTTTVYTNFIEKHNLQHGANFVVPPGYPNDSYHMNVETGEHVIVIPKGKGGNTNTNNFNMNVHTNAQASTVMRDFNMMRAMAG